MTVVKLFLCMLALLLGSTSHGFEANNPFDGVASGEYRIIGTLGLGSGEQQLNKQRDFFGYVSLGVTPAVGVWQVELRASRFDDSHVTVSQIGLNIKIDFTLNCYVQCLYWMVGWNYADLELNNVIKRGYWYHEHPGWYPDDRYIHIVDESGSDTFWNIGAGYRLMWTQNFDTSIEYNYNNVGKVKRVDLGHLRTVSFNLSYRF
ncbi:porin family protein [Microbulbifer sp. OS29]|uniref:Porin family protein n=1 Tax=Microbulbifer okhotskensis TaxID=2926617 RepID=A0A9X2J5S7_9GAMM|nr:outer membrane beta-barrel protein [Microbulbifer okhotskensis]MCO1332746.1 porin family protein [Microbulbifer okhotskensis]